MRATVMYGAGDVSSTGVSIRAACSTARVGLDDVPGGCRAMAERTALKVIIRP